MRLTEHLLLLDVADDPGEEGLYLLIDERAEGRRINCELDDLATLLVAPLYLAALYPPLKEAIIAKLLSLDDDRREIIGRVVQDCAEDIRREGP